MTREPSDQPQHTGPQPTENAQLPAKLFLGLLWVLRRWSLYFSLDWPGDIGVVVSGGSWWLQQAPVMEERRRLQWPPGLWSHPAPASLTLPQ